MLRTRILAAATATLLALGMAAGGASAATAAPPQEDKKVWVCKYSGTPGVNEQYKDGKNPIEVSVTTIANNSGFDPVTGTGYFADGQARSFSLGYSDTFAVPPTIEDCPRPVLPIPGYDVTDETCEAGGSITLDESEWITYVVTNSSGVVIPNDQLTNLPPGSYTVTPTAVPPAILDDEFYDPVAVIDAVDPALCAELATGDVSITPATCELGESLDESGIDAIGATFEVIDNGSTDGSYEVLFTAEEGYLFAGGLETLTVTGELAGPNSELCLEATGSVPLIDPTCELGASVDLANISGVNATYEVIDDGSTDGSYEVLFTASAGYRFAGNQQTLTVSGDLAERDPELCLEATGSVPLIDPTCELGASVDLENISGVNATFEVIDDGSESGSYEVLFTANAGYRFAGDQQTLTISGELAPKDERLCLVVTASFTLPPATCEVGEDWENPIIVADAGVTYGEPEFDPETQTVSITFLATGANIFVVDVEGEMSFSKTLTVTLDVADRDPSLCEEASPEVPINPATCELGESLDELGIDAIGATFTVIDNGATDGTYEIEFTADEGYRFAGDEQTLTVSGSLADRDPELCLEATGTVPIIDPTCELGASVDVEDISAVNATWEVIDDGSTDGSYEVLFTANDGYRFTGDQKTLTVSGELAPNDERLCLVVEASFTLPPATCEVGEDWENPIIVADAGVTYGEPEFDPETQTVSITFLATGANIFVVDVEGEPTFSKTLTVTLDVADRDPELCLEPTYVAPVIDATCELGESLDVEGIDAENATWVVVDDGSVSGTYEIVFTADEGYRFAGDEQTLTVSDELADRDPLLCEEASGSVPLIDPTCELGASVDLENISGVNATFEVIDDGSESGSYEVEFTALEGFRFAGDQTTLTVSGELADRDPELCLEPTYVAPLIDATCELGESLDVEGIDAENATWEVIDDGSESGTYEVEFTADEGYRFAGDQQTLTVTGELAGPNTELCLEAIAAIAVTDADCFFDSLLDEEGFTAENATYEITVYNAETREYEVVFTADYGYRFDTSLDGVSEDGMTRTFSGTLEAADPNGDGCVLPITDASIAFIDATCLDPQSLDVEGFEFDSELAELESVTYDGLDYTVVFVTIGEDTQFFQTDEPVEGRTVSEDGTVLTFTGTLDGPNEELCPEVIVPPIVVVDDCFEQSYTITDVEGVTYTRTVNGLELPVSFGEGDSVTYEAAPFDVVTVTAVAGDGYVLDESYEAFEYTFAFDEDCLPTAPVTTASVTWTQADCLGNPGSYTLTNEPGVIWTVDGVVVEGNTKYTAAIGSTPSIVASLEPASEEFPTGFGWSDEDQRTLWNLVFAAAEDCLPTLAITGASNALGGLGVIAILIMMAGTGLVVARRREAVRVQG